MLQVFLYGIIGLAQRGGNSDTDREEVSTWPKVHFSPGRAGLIDVEYLQKTKEALRAPPRDWDPPGLLSSPGMLAASWCRLGPTGILMLGDKAVCPAHWQLCSPLNPVGFPAALSP